MASLRLHPQATGFRIDGGPDGDAVDLGQVFGGQDVGRFAGCTDPTLVELDDPVGHRGGVVEVVQHHPDRDAVIVGEIPVQVQGFDLIAQVQVVGSSNSSTSVCCARHVASHTR
jgi:hypothetical protein